MTTFAQKRQELRRLLNGTGAHIAPGAADVLTARLVAQMGFPAVYLSGSLQHAMRGYADVNALTMSEMAQTAHNVANEVAVPCIADGETGFGIGINVVRMVREYERAGVAAIHLEDFTVPKRPARLGFESPTVARPSFSTRSRPRSMHEPMRRSSSSRARSCAATTRRRSNGSAMRSHSAPTPSGPAGFRPRRSSRFAGN